MKASTTIPNERYKIQQMPIKKRYYNVYSFNHVEVTMNPLQHDSKVLYRIPCKKSPTGGDNQYWFAISDGKLEFRIL